ncbi:MAG: YtxH domain-containing protein [Bacillota bacterium]|uniref:YtxH domain-containing protein n=1 Tax=Virgibacillus salarius TaxID=447199 RepID=A0A941DT45_9BACI|nr:MULTISPECIES: YtxH domain-containing protein [Virgibacillus]NAZ07947.1 YtxH domain-containing protein [Agaribacter marinus]MBR7795231.1 YtxH domain-containing protein [Virgibacillus salarius]MCC2251500.1 YtxH domain-containing protein [Virgibacillus sp. AGTR]MDY7046477.1 YtxH domain-containing protein [Virgibacillus sp. M23]QRZ19946.1 YtxH domain-containing protein [Virgibacillus sp. AGTR]
MGKRKLFLGVMIGATVGGLVTLFDKDTRSYSKEKLSTAKSGTSYLMKHPSEAVHSIRTAFDTFNRNFTTGAEKTIDALEQVEATLDKVANKNEANRIE